MLDLSRGVAAVTAQLVDVASVSGTERSIADAVESALMPVPQLDVRRDGDAVFAFTSHGRAQRVVLAGHLDTVPPADNLPGRTDGRVLHGLGSVDMKGGVAVMLCLAVAARRPLHDVTYAFYDGEEVEAERNGLLRVSRNRPDWLEADLAVLLEPTDGVLEGGCQGSLRADVSVPGRRAHTARSWQGSNAIHAAGEVLDALRRYEPRQPVVDGLQFHEGLNAVGIRGGIAGNVVPDECVVTVNYRFAPDRSEQDAEQHVGDVFAGYDVVVTDSASGARPGLAAPAAASLVDAIGGAPRAKLGWTDVARFAALGVPAVNYGPGDPSLSHTPHEHVDLDQVEQVLATLQRWLTAS